MMKQAVSLSLFVGLAFVSAVARGDIRPSLLAATYEQHVEAAERDAGQSRTRLRDAYGKALVDLEQTLRKEGDLEGLVALRTESTRFKESGRLPTTTSDGPHPRLRELCENVRGAIDRIELGKSRKVVSLTESYIAALDKLKTQLTTDGKFDEALGVRDEIANVRADAVYTAAQFVLASAAVDQSQQEVADEPPPKPVPAVAVDDGMVERVPHDLRNSLVLYYPFDSQERISVADRSGRGHGGKMAGTRWSGTSLIGGGCEFDGRSAHILVAESVGLEMGAEQGWSMAFFLRFDSLSSPSCLYSRGEPGTGLYCLAGGGEGELTWEPVNKGWSTGVRLEPGEWYHLTMVHDPSDMTATVYVNGMKRSEVHVSAIKASSGAIRIGNDTARRGFHGSMDEIMIFSHALSGPDARGVFESTGGDAAIATRREKKAEAHFIKTGRGRIQTGRKYQSGSRGGGSRGGGGRGGRR